MAKVLTIAASGQESTTFIPQTSFLIYAAGLPSGTNFQIQMRPIGVSNAAWVAARSDITDSHLTNAIASAVVNGSPGFEFRIHADSAVSALTTIYWDHITTLKAFDNPTFNV